MIWEWAFWRDLLFGRQPAQSLLGFALFRAMRQRGIRENWSGSRICEEYGSILASIISAQARGMMTVDALN